MKEFDIQINMNGVENEINTNLVREKRNFSSEFEGEEDTTQDKKSWTDTLDNLTNTFKEVTGYKTNEEKQAERDKELAEKGTKYKILGMNPFVAIGLSFAVIIGGSIALYKIK